MDAPKTEEELETQFTKAFEWIAKKWEEDSDKTWADLRDDFVKELDFDDADKHSVVVDFVQKVNDLPVSDEEDQQYDLLTDKDERDKVLDPLIEEWAKTLGDEDEAEAEERRYDEDREIWLVWNADKEEWFAEDGRSLAEVDAAAEEADPDVRDDPSAVAGDVILKIGVPALETAIGEAPELIELSAEERHELIVKVLNDRIAASS